MTTKILCMEPDQDIGELVKICLKQLDVDVEILRRPVDGVNRLGQNGVGLVIIDTSSSTNPAYSFARLAKTRKLPVILIEPANSARSRDGYVRVGKPFNPTYLQEQVENILRGNGSAGSAANGSSGSSYPV